MYLSFRLPDDFVDDYAKRLVNWGFQIGAGNSLSELTFLSRYSRIKSPATGYMDFDETKGAKEQWFETCRRVIEGTYSIQKDWCVGNRTPWNELKAQHAARDAYDRLWSFKWTPPGRGLWAMGTAMVNERKNSAPLMNCSFLTTATLSTRSHRDATFPFVRMMEEAMCGIGVGFDTMGAGKLTIHEPTDEEDLFVVPDTREGWAEAFGRQLVSYFFPHRPRVRFDISLIRPAGAPLKTFGGKAAGPEPLIRLYEAVEKLFAGRVETTVSSSDIVDLMNLGGKCVVAGGTRRSAQLSLGLADDKDFLDLKNWELNPERMGADGWGHLSNNSIQASVGTDYEYLVARIASNGEPGLVYLDLCRSHGRLADPVNHKDDKVTGVNPCFRGDTLIGVADGRGAVSIKQLAEEGKDVPVYSCTPEGKVEVQWGRYIRLTRSRASLVEVAFNIGSIFVTPDHTMLLLDGTTKSASELVQGDTVPRFTNDSQAIQGYRIVEEVRTSASADVYNLRVDYNHTVAIVTERLENDALSGIFTPQCSEIPLTSTEKCTLSEVYPTHHDNLDDFLRTVKFAYLYGKTVTLLPTQWPETNEVMARNRRIGLSMSGLAQFVEGRGWHELKRWMDAAYEQVSHRDRQYSEWLGVRESIKMTTVKPSGTTSLVTGVTPGVHWPVADTYIRRMRFSVTEEIVEVLRKAGYHVEPDVMDPQFSVVVELPTKGPQVRTEREVSVWEKVALAVMAQRHWADNSVSVTGTFLPSERDQIGPVLRAFDGQLKTISFLPLLEEGDAYQQAPYSRITEQDYEAAIAKVKPLNWKQLYNGAADAEDERFCNNDRCEIPQ